jgi:hypothetical protein
MEDFITAVAPAFAAGFAVQRTLELVDTWFLFLAETSPIMRAKPAVLVTLSFIVGLILTSLAPFRVLAALGMQDVLVADFLVTALVISAGTEGFNSILKFLEYAKADKKGQAALSKASAGAALASVDPGDSALSRPEPTTTSKTTVTDRSSQVKIDTKETVHGN